jgi:hypothetical protein
MYKLFKVKVDDLVLRRDFKLTENKKRGTVLKDEFIELIVGSVYTRDSKASKDLEKNIERISRNF